MHRLFPSQMKRQLLCAHAKRCVDSTNNIIILMLHDSKQNKCQNAETVNDSSTSYFRNYWQFWLRTNIVSTPQQGTIRRALS